MYQIRGEEEELIIIICTNFQAHNKLGILINKYYYREKKRSNNNFIKIN